MSRAVVLVMIVLASLTMAFSCTRNEVRVPEWTPPEGIIEVAQYETKFVEFRRSLFGIAGVGDMVRGSQDIVNLDDFLSLAGGNPIYMVIHEEGNDGKYHSNAVPQGIRYELFSLSVESDMLFRYTHTQLAGDPMRCRFEGRDLAMNRLVFSGEGPDSCLDIPGAYLTGQKWDCVHPGECWKSSQESLMRRSSDGL